MSLEHVIISGGNEPIKVLRIQPKVISPIKHGTSIKIITTIKLKHITYAHFHKSY